MAGNDPIDEGAFAGQVAIVTGGGTSAGRVPSIGEAVARLLARRGVKVAIVDIDETAAGRTVATIVGEGGEAGAIVADLRDEAGCAAAVAAALARFGRLDILINNVGFGSGGVVTGLSEADFDLAFAVNLKSATFMAKAAIPRMTGGGAIVNLSTTAVQYPTRSLTYSASKAAVEALTHHIAMQFGPDGIRCNTVRPGEVWTAMVDRNCATGEEAERLRTERASRSALPYDGDAWDVAHAVVFLAGPEARWITGQTLSVEGGTQLIRPNPDWKSQHSYWKAKRS
jgi:NAD(P)-dependent dehydrogenase (short-subunit alcohol dehydrogenase family)